MLYWDANSTSKLRPVAVSAAEVLLRENRHLNPSSIHSEGRKARAELRRAKDQILSYLFPNDQDPLKLANIVFVSGGTEGCNSLIHGYLAGINFQQSTVVSSAIEHAAILEPLKNYKFQGVNSKLVNAKLNGVVDVDEFISEIDNTTVLSTLMLANNETGKGQNVSEIATIIKKKFSDTVFVSDITQAVSKTSLDLASLFESGVDAVVLSAHKIGAMPGIGAIIFNSKATCRFFHPLILGGGQEGKLRGGTEFLFGAKLFGEVCHDLKKNGEKEIAVRRRLKFQLIDKLHAAIPELKILGDNSNEYDLVNTLYIQAPNTRADDLAVALDIEGLMVSTGSACSSGRQDVSHVPLALGYSKDEAREFFRVSLDWDVKEKELDKGVELIKRTLSRFIS